MTNTYKLYYRIIKDYNELDYFKEDVLSCYLSTDFTHDTQCTYKPKNTNDVLFLHRGHLNPEQHCLIGIFARDYNEEEHLCGLVIFNNIRAIKDRTVADLHMVSDRIIWGMPLFKILCKMMKETIFNQLNIIIPSCGGALIRLIKRLGFKKTGYIPECCTYRNIKGQEIFYDKYLYVLDLDKKRKEWQDSSERK